LEERLARFEGAEAAVVFPTGYAANTGTIAALVGSGDAVFCDRLNHASLIDGCRNSEARFRVYPHLDLETLERELKKSTEARRRLIVTDSVFSMDGDVAPLAELSELSRRYDAMLLIDEAHATGVLGTLGRGLAEHDGIDKRNLITVGTLSKAAGAMGGFVAGGRTLCDWLWNTARPQVFSTALFTPAAAAACAALDVIEAEPWRRERLLELASRLRESLVSLGCRIPPTRIVTPIIPIILGEEARTVDAARRLEAAGFLVAAIRPPTVPRGQSRLRLSLHALLTDDDVTDLVQAIRDVVEH
jgi:8-amino-7-oxononanoate synthase